MKKNWLFIVLHHTGDNFASGLADIDKAHKDRETEAGTPWRGCGYHFVINDEGKVEPSMRWKKQIPGAHLRVDSEKFNFWNRYAIGVGVIGNFEQISPNADQEGSVIWLSDLLMKAYNIPASRIVGHSEVEATKCPGEKFLENVNIIRREFMAEEENQNTA